MPPKHQSRSIHHAFVTGATGLLGNNLVRSLLKKGIQVTALVRSRQKALEQFGNLPIHFIEGDICQPDSYQNHMQDCDSLFHTAAFFRDSLKGGQHWQELYNTNVKGSLELFEAAYKAGIRQAVHTSSIAVLYGEQNQLIDESMLRSRNTSNDYYRSKILSEEVLLDFSKKHPDFFVSFVLPGFMFGPGDIGPTSAGQLIFDFVHKKLPGIIPGSYSVVDARDVADCEILAMQYGRQGERYLAAGRHMTMEELLKNLEAVSGVAAPTRRIPLFLLNIIAQYNELYHRLTKRPILLSKAAVTSTEEEYLRTHFNSAKSQNELGAHFRPFEETLKDVLAWYKEHGYLS
ncbi:SDR family oxidoreductase [uncultured Streptococcus sp.]|uniref:SDR family oxidoreductase n=1 Tax=uncultured Streptococcus sp. TaxID=83427 RepID=UPI0028E295FE|nr:SDR family oxidoreductase [uncultured Streptococcus sp.]